MWLALALPYAWRGTVHYRYGAATELVMCFKAGTVERFALDPSLGEFIHTHTNVQLPADGGKKIYSCNEGNAPNWDAAILKAVDDFKKDNYAARYVGSMVSDVHRTILYGGIFVYPADKKSPKGKLRVLYEGFPMALIVESAGGVASTGMFNGRVSRMLDLLPKGIHERCPVILGCARDVNRVRAAALQHTRCGVHIDSISSLGIPTCRCRLTQSPAYPCPAQVLGQYGAAAAPQSPVADIPIGRTPSFIESGFPTRVEYEASIKV